MASPNADQVHESTLPSAGCTTSAVSRPLAASVQSEGFPSPGEVSTASRLPLGDHMTPRTDLKSPGMCTERVLPERTSRMKIREISDAGLADPAHEAIRVPSGDIAPSAPAASSCGVPPSRGNRNAPAFPRALPVTTTLAPSGAHASERALSSVAISRAAPPTQILDKQPKRITSWRIKSVSSDVGQGFPIGRDRRQPHIAVERQLLIRGYLAVRVTGPHRRAIRDHHGGEQRRRPNCHHGLAAAPTPRSSYQDWRRDGAVRALCLVRRTDTEHWREGFIGVGHFSADRRSARPLVTESFGQSGGLRGRLRIELGDEAPRELVVGTNRARPVAGSVEQRDQAPQRPLGSRIEAEHLAGVLNGEREIPGAVRGVAQRRGSRYRTSAQACAFVFEPLPELRGHASDVEPFEKVSAVERQRLGGMTAVERTLEFAHVAPDRSRLNTDFFVTPAYENVRAKRLPQEVQTLTERLAGLLDVGLGPEEREERVAAVEALPSGEGEVRKEGEALRLDEDSSHLVAPRPAKFERAKDVEPHGWRPSRPNWVAVIRQVTVA